MNISFDKISYLAYRKGESISSLERKAGISNGNIKRWYLGTSPSLDNLAKLCDFLGVTLNDIVENQKTHEETLEQRQIELYQSLFRTYQVLVDRQLKNPLQVTLSSINLDEFLDLDETEVDMIPVFKQLLIFAENQYKRKMLKKHTTHRLK